MLVALDEALECILVAAPRATYEESVRIFHVMKILLWHGYLLGGTGSNVYTRALARAWARAGHEVVVFCQEPHPDRYDLGGATVVRPELEGPLPVFVLDRYEGVEPAFLQDLTWEQRRDFVERNAAAVREHLPADFLLTNHVLLGAPVGVAAGMPFSVKAHGSELEFSIRGNTELSRWARESLDRAETVFAGSEHIRGVLEEVVGPHEYLERVKVVPPGVDIEELVPSGRESAFRALVAEARRDPPNPGCEGERLPDPGNADRLEAFLVADEPTVVYVGKLSDEKGVHLLLEALRAVEARAVLVGFGPARSELEALVSDCRVLFTGPLEHRHLKHLWALADVSVTPSVFPEAFGMVAAEAAACGSPPLVARHSGLAEIAAGIEAEYEPEYRHLTSFQPGDAADLAAKLRAILALAPEERHRLGEAARRAVVRRWSWERVAALLLSRGWETPSA
jgi:glycosyltransferase involved in cell wall biosynthesis